MARACAAKTNATFLKIAAPQLVQMFIGDGAKLVRDAFALAREKAPAIIFVNIFLFFTIFTVIRLMKLMPSEPNVLIVTSQVIGKYKELCWSFLTN